MDAFDSAWVKAGPRRLFATFSGTGSEYFRIWAVNTLLTIVTLGAYLPYAKVRKRRWFYWNTYLDGMRFDYLAEPRMLVIGYALVGVALLISNLAGSFYPTLGGALTLLFYSAVPWIVYKAHRFKARYSSYRGIRFRFLGTLKEAYRVYGLIPGLAMLPVIGLLVFIFRGDTAPDLNTLTAWLVPAGLLLAPLYPWWIFLRRRYTYSNFAYGKAVSWFSPSLKFFYLTYLKAAAMTVVAFAGIFGLITGVFGTAALTGEATLLGYVGVPLIVLLYASGYALVEQYLYATLTNHCWNTLRLGTLRFSVDLDPWRLFWLRVSNGVAIVLSLGFFAPWAAVRRHSYIASRFSVLADEALETVIGAADDEVTAVGDAASDFFDLDIGW